KSYKFALRIVKLFQYLSVERKEYVLSKQILRSGTSVGANIEEAYQGESKMDFIHKLAIANKEAFETHYWLRLLRDSIILERNLAESMMAIATRSNVCWSPQSKPRNQEGNVQLLISHISFLICLSSSRL